MVFTLLQKKFDTTNFVIDRVDCMNVGGENFLKIKLQDGEKILSQQNNVMQLHGWLGYFGKIITTNKRIVFVRNYLVLGLIFTLLFPKTKIDVSLPYSKISTSLGNHGKSKTVIFSYKKDDTTTKEYKFVINKPEDWLVEVEKNIQAVNISGNI